MCSITKTTASPVLLTVTNSPVLSDWEDFSTPQLQRTHMCSHGGGRSICLACKGHPILNADWRVGDVESPQHYCWTATTVKHCYGNLCGGWKQRRNILVLRSPVSIPSSLSLLQINSSTKSLVSFSIPYSSYSIPQRAPDPASKWVSKSSIQSHNTRKCQKANYD